jgi:hypothetical protein
MPGSTYSTNLKVELMATGENSGTWGDITNTNLGTALEQAIVGYGNPDYASDANLTISITNSNAAQAARALVLNVTSSLSLTATRELVVPTIQKQYIVQNNTTGSQSITVKTSAGTGITVPNGRKAHLYVDGTNVIQMFDFVDINGGAIDGTTIGAASASTGAFTTLNASGATTLDGNVTLGNASGDNVTVTGTITSNLLFTDNTYDIGASGATRPRNLFLAGAATIGGNLSVGGTLTLTGGVNLNGNVTVGDSSSDTLTINSTITSNLIFTDNTYDIGASGATRPRNLFLAGNATISGNQTLTGSLTVDSTTDSSSTTTGSIQTDGGLGVAKALYVGTTANIAGAVTLGGGTANGVAYLNGSNVLTTGSALTFDGTNFATTGTITSGGSYNFNTTSGRDILWGTGSYTYITGNPTTGVMAFGIASSELMRLTNTGLGIGTSSLTVGRVNVAKSAASGLQYVLAVTAEQTTGFDRGAAIAFPVSESSTTTLAYIGTRVDKGAAGDNAQAIVFGTNQTNSAPVEKVRITSDGYFLVGTNSATSNSGPSMVTQVGAANETFIRINHDSGASSGGWFMGFSYNGTAIGSITQNGTTAVAYNTSSDYRLKNITGPVSNSGAYIDALKPCEGTWKADGSTFVGLIAHEAQAVSRTPVATGTKDGEQIQGMDYSNSEFIANIIAELQSLRTRVAALESN